MMLANIKFKYLCLLLALTIGFHSVFIYAYDEKETSQTVVYCKNYNDLDCEIAWNEKNEENLAKEDLFYHIFLSETENDLSPHSFPEDYFNSEAAQKTFLSSIQKTSITLPRIDSYIRIICQDGYEFKDVTNPININALPEKETLNNGSGVTILPPNWSLIKPYLLPKSSNIKPALDKIFTKGRVLNSVDDVRKSGFRILFHREGRGLIVAKHPLIKNYLFKMYLDTLPKAEWQLFVKRARGAKMIREVIEEHRLEVFVKVPQKYIYKLPSKPSAAQGENIYPKNFVLLVEDMHIADDATNKYLYAQAITRGHLNALKCVIEKCGLSDSHVGNIPFSYDNKIAFIDTEYNKIWPVHLEWITKSLIGGRQRYWMEIIK